MGTQGQKGIRYIFTMLHCIANDMERFSGDLFLDTPDIVEKWNKNEAITICVAKSHADLLDRFIKGFNSREGYAPTYDEALLYADKTLGLDYYITLDPKKYDATKMEGEGSFASCITLTNYKLDKFKEERIYYDIKLYFPEATIITDKTKKQ